MINDIESLSLTLHGINIRFIHQLFNVKNYSINHKSETGQPKKKTDASEFPYFPNVHNNEIIISIFCNMMKIIMLLWKFSILEKNILHFFSWIDSHAKIQIHYIGTLMQ